MPARRICLVLRKQVVHEKAILKNRPEKNKYVTSGHAEALMLVSVMVV